MKDHNGKNYPNYQHGYCKGHKLTGIYLCWVHLLQRIRQKSLGPLSLYWIVSQYDSDFRWFKFENFLADMKEGYFQGATLDRIDWRRGYYKENCRWLTRAENTRRAHRWQPDDFFNIMKVHGGRVALEVFSKRYDWEMNHECHHYIICRWKNSHRSKFYLGLEKSYEAITNFLRACDAR